MLLDVGELDGTHTHTLTHSPVRGLHGFSGCYVILLYVHRCRRVILRLIIILLNGNFSKPFPFNLICRRILLDFILWNDSI